MICSLFLIYFDKPELGINLKNLFKTFNLLIQRYAQFWFFRKGSGNSFSTIFCVWFFKNVVSHVDSIRMACVVEVASFDPLKKKQGTSFFTANSDFCLKKQGLSLMHQNILTKLSTENSYFMVNIVNFHNLILPIKISKEIS